MARVINLVRRSEAEWNYEEEIEPEEYWLPEPTGRPIPVAPRFGVTRQAQALFQDKQKERDRAIKQYASTPAGFFWQFSKKRPDFLERIPIAPRVLSPVEIIARFPEIQKPLPVQLEPVQLILPPPRATKIFRGTATLPSGEVREFWEDVTGKLTTAPEPPPRRTRRIEESMAGGTEPQEFEVFIRPETRRLSFYEEPQPETYDVKYENLDEY